MIVHNQSIMINLSTSRATFQIWGIGVLMFSKWGLSFVDELAPLQSSLLRYYSSWEVSVIFRRYSKYTKKNDDIIFYFQIVLRSIRGHCYSHFASTSFALDLQHTRKKNSSKYRQGAMKSTVDGDEACTFISRLYNFLQQEFTSNSHISSWGAVRSPVQLHTAVKPVLWSISQKDKFQAIRNDWNLNHILNGL